MSALVSLLGRVTQSLSWFSGNLCAHRIQFSAWSVSKRPSPVGIWHARWDGEGIILDGELQGVGEEIVVGLEQCYSQALMPDLWWCPSLASLLRTVTPPSRGAFSKLFVPFNIRLSLKVWK